MYYIISITYLPDELIKEIQLYLPNAREGFLFINKEDLSLYDSYILLLDTDFEEIDIEKLKELLVLKRLQE